MSLRYIAALSASISIALPFQVQAQGTTQTVQTVRDGIIEICVQRGSSTGCFVESRESGRSRFFADDASLDFLLTDAYVSQLPLEFQSVQVENYKLLRQSASQRALVNLETTEFSFGVSENCDNPNGWGQCIAGTIGGAILGGLSGASLGPVGIGLGTLGGGLAGSAASGCWNDGNCASGGSDSSGSSSSGDSDDDGGASKPGRGGDNSID